jgi:hypothetical protein
VADPFPASLQAALADMAKWLEAAHIPAMIIGGVAAAAKPRCAVPGAIAAVLRRPGLHTSELLVDALEQVDGLSDAPVPQHDGSAQEKNQNGDS